MDCSMGMEHLRRIVGAVPEGGRMLEWGSGWSTVWWAEHLPRGARLRSVEHDAAWHGRVSAALGERMGSGGGGGGGGDVEYLLRAPEGEVGAYGSLAVEDATNLRGYLAAGGEGLEGEGRGAYDVVLVDGWARGACLERARELVRPGGTMFLHDAQRDRYDGAKGVFDEAGWEVGCVGSCPDYPIPQLWWARRRGAGAQRHTGTEGGTEGGELPVVVSFCTAGTRYVEGAARLRAACDRLGLEHDIVEVAPFGDHTFTRAYKGRYALEAWRRHGRPVLWVDADAELVRVPEELRGLGADAALCRVDGWEVSSAAVFINQSELGRDLLAMWVRMSQGRPGVHPSVHLDRAWEAVTLDRPLETVWLGSGFVGGSGGEAGVCVVHEGGRTGGVDEGVRRARVASRARVEGERCRGGEGGG